MSNTDFFAALRAWGPTMQNEAAILRKQISEGYDGEKKTSARRNGPDLLRDLRRPALSYLWLLSIFFLLFAHIR